MPGRPDIGLRLLISLRLLLLSCIGVRGLPHARCRSDGIAAPARLGDVLQVDHRERTASGEAVLVVVDGRLRAFDYRSREVRVALDLHIEATIPPP